MSVTAEPLALTAPAKSRLRKRAGVALAAIAIVAAAAALLVWILAPTAPPPPARAPFGAALRETAPSVGGIGGAILAIQASFYRSLQTALSGLKESGAALWSLLALGFSYGVFHAAGPGHGKAVIAAYLVASERSLLKGFGLSLAAAFLQALVAILLVSTASVLLQATAATMTRVTVGVELLSFAAVALLGATVTWRKAGKLLGVVALARSSRGTSPDEACDHVHLPRPDVIDGLSRVREMAGVVLAAGTRPCAGALVILVFALSQGLFAAGMAATLAMAVGTALTTGFVAALAVFAKGFALRIAGGRGAQGAVAVTGLELLGAAFVFVLGATLLFGLWSTAGS